MTPTTLISICDKQIGPTSEIYENHVFCRCAYAAQPPISSQTTLGKFRMLPVWPKPQNDANHVCWFRTWPTRPTSEIFENHFQSISIRGMRANLLKIQTTFGRFPWVANQANIRILRKPRLSISKSGQPPKHTKTTLWRFPWVTNRTNLPNVRNPRLVDFHEWQIRSISKIYENRVVLISISH